MQLTALHPSGAAAFVDYAHKPEALAKALEALRPHTTGRLVVVFGCGGDRDAGKRPLMGEIATRLADSPSSPTTIRAARMPPRSGGRFWPAPAVPARSATARRPSGRHSTASAAGDTLLVAGKGHETYQLVGDRVLPFDDARCCARRPATPGNRAVTAIWTAETVAAATGGSTDGDWVACGVSIDTRTLAPGDLFVALWGRIAMPRVRGRRRSSGAPRRRMVSRMPEDVLDPAGIGRGRRHAAAFERSAGPARAPHRGRIAASPAASARPAARRPCAMCWRGRRRPMPVPPATTTIGACR